MGWLMGLGVFTWRFRVLITPIISARVSPLGPLSYDWDEPPSRASGYRSSGLRGSRNPEPLSPRTKTLKPQLDGLLWDALPYTNSP